MPYEIVAICLKRKKKFRRKLNLVIDSLVLHISWGCVYRISSLPASKLCCSNIIVCLVILNTFSSLCAMKEGISEEASQICHQLN